MDRTPYRFEPVTPHTAGDLERFSRAHGKFRYCSCQRWRLPSAQYRSAGRDGRVASLDAAALEAYPWPGGATYRFMGTRDLYLGARFRDVPVPEGSRPVMRRPLR